MLNALLLRPLNRKTREQLNASLSNAEVAKALRAMADDLIFEKPETQAVYKYPNSLRLFYLDIAKRLERAP